MKTKIVGFDEFMMVMKYAQNKETLDIVNTVRGWFAGKSSGIVGTLKDEEGNVKSVDDVISEISSDTGISEENVRDAIDVLVSKNVLVMQDGGISIGQVVNIYDEITDSTF